MKNIIFEMHDNRDVHMYRCFTSSDIAACKSIKSDKLELHIGALWASFQSETLLSFIKEDFEHLAAVQAYLEKQDFTQADKEELDMRSTQQLRRIKFMLEKRAITYHHVGG